MDVVSPRYSFQSPFPGDRAAEPRGTKVRGLGSPPLEGDPSLAQTPDCGVAQAEGVSSELGPAAEAEAFIHSTTNNWSIFCIDLQQSGAAEQT